MHGHDQVHIDTFAKGEPSAEPDDHEAEADEFAKRHLLVDEVLEALPKDRKPTAREVIRAAGRAKVAPGVVVGQLQHGDGPLGFNNLNNLKRRYKWNGITLETA